MGTVFNECESVFFAGGTGSKVGDSQAGGCTREWFKTRFNSLSDIMGSDGSPLVNQTGCFWQNTLRRVAKTGAFGGIEPGMVAWVYDANGEFMTGRYRITNASADWVELWGCIGGGDSAGGVMIKIGGAFGNLQQALDLTLGTYYSTEIYTNKSETSLGGTIDIDTGGGDILKNTHKRVIGFHTVPGDMEPGGEYYQSPMEAYLNGVDEDCSVVYDGGGGAFSIFRLYQCKNIELRNLCVRNTNRLNSNSGIKIEGTPISLRLVNCRFDGLYQAMSGSMSQVHFERCQVGSDFSDQGFSLGTGSSVFGSVISANSQKACVGTDYGCSAIVCGNLLIGGGRGINACGQMTVINNVFYGQQIVAVQLNGYNGLPAQVSLYNNIIQVQPGAYMYRITANGGTVRYEDYNCVCDVNGQPLSNLWLIEYPGAQPSEMGEHTLQENPMFVNPSAGDFRSRNRNVLRGGRPDAGRRSVAMGAMFWPSRQVGRGRTSNFGRMQIQR